MSGITRRSFVVSGSATALASALPWPAWADAAAVYRGAVVIDGLGGLGNSATNGPLTAELVKDAVDSGITCVHITMRPVGTTAPDQAFAQAVINIGQMESEIDAHPEAFTRVRTATDIVTAKKAGKLGLIYGFQDGVAFETDLSRIDELHRLGLRIVQPTYNRRNLLGDGCLEPANAGLSLAGVQAIERLNEIGILVDLSHCGRQTAADALKLSKKPVAFTHTGCAALNDHPRNRTDAEIRACAEKGGVIGIYFMPFLSEGRQPTADDVLRHLEHLIQVAGEDHVSIGTDGGISPEVMTPEYKERHASFIRDRRAAGISAPGETEEGYLFANELNTPRRLETLADLLLARGHSSGRVEKILGSNLLRVLSETWKA
jgi:membrane dipeptidase